MESRADVYYTRKNQEVTCRHLRRRHHLARQLDGPEILPGPLMPIRNTRRPFDNRRVRRATQQALIRETSKLFRAEKDKRGRPWKPLSPAYASRKRGPQILIETGRLVKSLLRTRGKDVFFRARGRKAEWGTTVPYAGPVTAIRDFLPAVTRDVVRAIIREVVR